MSKNLAEIIQPLIEKGQFESPESAVRNLMTDYILRQIAHYRRTLNKFQKKYGMNYDQFLQYVKERARQVQSNAALQKDFMTEEEDALEWKIAKEMLESWVGLKAKALDEHVK